VSDYRIHVIESSSDPLYAAAITLYATCIPREVATNTNEITMWLDSYNERFYPDMFRVIAFLKDEQVIGYCQYAVFTLQKLLVVDYIAIGKAHRRGVNVYCTFLTLLKQMLTREHSDFDAVLEVIDLPVYGRRFEELLKRSGFAPMNYPYVQPALGDMKQELTGRLMIYPPRIIPPSEFRRISNTIRHDHYERWYSYLSLPIAPTVTLPM
jgi:hypothetical protein